MFKLGVLMCILVKMMDLLMYIRRINGNFDKATPIIVLQTSSQLDELLHILTLAPIHTHTASTADNRFTYQQRQPHGIAQDGSAADRDTSRRRFVVSKGSEVTDPQIPDLLREAGRQSKARHNFLTFLACNRVNTG